MFQGLPKITLVLFSLILFFIIEIIAGTTGKIAGIIVDQNGEPLPGVNVIIEGTSLGAATDIEGQYSILNVPPGTYNLKVSMVGYQPVSVEQIRVNVDQTSRVDVELKESSITFDEVTVIARRNIVDKDVSASVTTVSSDEMEALPVTTIGAVVQLQAGVENGLVIRGGGADQSLFLLDGIAMRDARNNQPVTNFALSSVKEVSLERGGFNAEYGQVRSGILNVITKEGDKTEYSGTFSVKYSPPSYKHFDLSPYDPGSMWLRPYLDPAVSFVGTKNGLWDEYTQRQYPVFDGWNEISRQLLEDNDPSNDLSPEAAKKLFEWQHRKRPVTNKPDYDIDAGFGGPIPIIGKSLGYLRFFLSYKKSREMLLIPLTRDDYQEDNWTLKLTSDISQAMKLTLSGIMGKSYNIAANGTELAVFGSTNGLTNSTTYIRSAQQIADQISFQPFTSSSRIFSDSYYSLAEVEHFGLSASLTHILNPTSFYDISVDFFERDYNTGPTRERNEVNNIELFSGYYTNEAPFGWSSLPTTGIGDGILFGGHTSTSRDSSKASSLKFKFDLTSQINFNHQIKTGLEFVYNNLDLKFGTYNRVFPESNTFIDETYNPILAAFYVQDKIEFEGFIANLGVRLDYNDPNTDWANVDPFNRRFFGSGFSDNVTYETRSSEKQISISPRMGISHPITENSKLYFNYGHFKQLPSYEQLFQLSRGASNQIRLFGDPNLQLAKTISYELGYDHALFDEYLVQAAGFYHDISDQTAITRYISADGGVVYSAINSNNYEDIRGAELTIKKLRGNWVRGFLTYTYQVTTQGRFGRDIFYEDPSEQRRFNSNTGNFAQNRPVPAPYANLVLTLFTPSDFGPKFLDSYLFGDFSLTVIGSWRAGWYATRNPNQLANVSQNVQAQDYLNFDLRFSKDVNIQNFTLTFLIDANNLLNTRRLSLAGFYDNQDFEDYWNSLHLPKSDAYNNIVGDDRYGEFRDPDVTYQPIIRISSIGAVESPNSRPFYYETSSGRYMQYTNGSWNEVDKGTLDQVLNDKAYIDMPNQTSFNFLNPRNIFFGIRMSLRF